MNISVVRSHHRSLHITKKTTANCNRLFFSSHLRLRQFSNSSSSNSKQIISKKKINIPVIDISHVSNGTATLSHKQTLAKNINNACENIGFMTILGHGISKDLIKATWEQTRSYFDLSVEEKQRIPMTEEYPYGYSGFAEETLNKGFDPNKKHHTPDLKEMFCIGPYNPLSLMPAIRWPPNQVLIQQTWLHYYKAVEVLCSRLLSLFALALDLPENWFETKIDRHRSALRFLNYPQIQIPTIGPDQELPLRAGAHTDYGTVTILKNDDMVRGLQVLNRQKEWCEVEPIPDSFVINLGDLMQRWTNDRWISTLHRVVIYPHPTNPTVSPRRQSIAFFHNLNVDCMVETIPSCVSPQNPSKYPPINAWEHLLSKHHAATKY